jgi:hypothetical protein
MLAIVSIGGFFSLASTCGQLGPCECFTCFPAIDLAVFDADGNALDTGWTVEATLDGFAVDDIANCDPEFRFGNACSFGSSTGIYRITVRGQEFEPHEMAARVSARSGDDCCGGLCVASTSVSAFLDPVGEVP